MSVFSCPEGLTEEQSQTLEQAALLIINARKEAAAMLTRSGMRELPERGWWGTPCGMTLPPPPAGHRCGCRDYTGDGGPCLSTYIDHTGPDLGTGGPRRTCGHLPSQHVET
jgi:hypothetical protein